MQMMSRKQKKKNQKQEMCESEVVSGDGMYQQGEEKLFQVKIKEDEVYRVTTH